MIHILIIGNAFDKSDAVHMIFERFEIINRAVIDVIYFGIFEGFTSLSHRSHCIDVVLKNYERFEFSDFFDFSCSNAPNFICFSVDCPCTLFNVGG